MKKLKIYQPEMEQQPPFFVVNMDECKLHENSSGYNYRFLPTHPYCDYHGYVLEHRLVVEQYLGRYLTGSEVIHHIDHNKRNNEIDNLWLFPDQASHLRVGHCPTQNKKLVDEVLLAAQDTSINFSDLSCSKHTARRILSTMNVKWQAGDEIEYTEDEVKDALYRSNGVTASAAKLLGSTAATLRKNFPHLLNLAQTKIYFLDDSKEQLILDYDSGMTMGKLAEKYSTTKKSIYEAFVRWNLQTGRNRNRNKRKLDHLIPNFLEDYYSGLKITHIAQKYQSNISTVKGYLEREGIVFVDRRKPYWLDDHKDEILKLRKEGLRYIDIANHFDTNRVSLRMAVNRWLKDDDQRIESAHQ